MPPRPPSRPQVPSLFEGLTAVQPDEKLKLSTKPYLSATPGFASGADTPRDFLERCLADLAAHEKLIAVAHDDARLVLARDPTLSTPRGQALRTLLYLFQRDEAVQYLRAG